MGYEHFSIEERCCLREYYKKGLSYRKIAELLGRNVSSVSRELRRNCTHYYDVPKYYPHTAQKKSKLRRSYCHRGMFWTPGIIPYIESKLLETWSPEQISHAPSPFEKMPSTRTIYRWLYDKYLLAGNLKVLRRKGKSHNTSGPLRSFSRINLLMKKERALLLQKQSLGKNFSEKCDDTLSVEFVIVFIEI